MNKVPRDIREKLQDSALIIDQNFKKSLKNQLFLKENDMAKAKKVNPLTQLTAFFKQNNAVPLTAVIIALVAVGGTSALVTNNRAEQARQSEIELPATLDSILSVDEIQAIALIDEPSLEVLSIELENEDEGLLYSVTYSDGSVRYYDASNGMLVTRNSNNYEVDESVPAGFVAGISINEARQIAQNQRPGKTVTKIELETEEGVVVYSVRFSDNGRVDINATNGNVLSVRSASENRDSDDDYDSSDSYDDRYDDSYDDSSDDSYEDEKDEKDEEDEKDEYESRSYEDDDSYEDSSDSIED